MAKYDVTYKCGHTKTVSLFGKMVDRKRKIEWLETQLCPECEAAESDLIGTAKQIAWAEKIRSEKMGEIKEFEEMFEKASEQLKNADDAPAEYLDNYKKISEAINRVKTEKSASWWIDNRAKAFGVNFFKEIAGIIE